MTEPEYTPDESSVRDQWNSSAIGAEELAETNAEFDRFIARIKAEAWDACVSYGEACGYFGPSDALDLEASNPHRETP